MKPRLPELAGAGLDRADVDRIEAQWRALAPPYDVERWRIPLPVWATRSFDQDGCGAWEVLREDLRLLDPANPVCIYVHVPFCSSKCGFCDCYSFALPPRHAEHKRRYVQALCQELALWADLGNLASRPVSTVHLGGGTPTFLGPHLLSELVDCIRTHFTTDARTEWATESTTHCLTPAMLDTMQGLGFTRLHVGVQSLEETVRSAIGRRSSTEAVLAVMARTLDLGWIVTVDMICGLPGQTLPSFARDVHTLMAAGVDGVSLYELLIYPQNRRWAGQRGLLERSHFPNYLMFQVGAAVLEASGYRKNTFNHWADGRDDNRYFTFPTRGEDCLAVGAIADGVFGDYHTRHLRYAAYLRAAGTSPPGLEGGLRRTARENRLQPLTTALMSGHVPAGLLAQLDDLGGDTSLVERWIELGLASRSTGGGLDLLTNGSWFAGNMIQEATGLYPAASAQR